MSVLQIIATNTTCLRCRHNICFGGRIRALWHTDST